jgi:hypothetical protein
MKMLPMKKTTRSKRVSKKLRQLIRTSLKQVSFSKGISLRREKCLRPKRRIKSPSSRNFRLLTTKSMKRINRMLRILPLGKESL